MAAQVLRSASPAQGMPRAVSIELPRIMAAAMRSYSLSSQPR